jgi:hypothetical protein
MMMKRGVLREVGCWTAGWRIILLVRLPPFHDLDLYVSETISFIDKGIEIFDQLCAGSETRA